MIKRYATGERRITLVLLACVVAGCATPIGVRRIDPFAANRALTANVLASGEPSDPAKHYLYRLGLADRYQSDPAGTIALLHDGLGQIDEPYRLFALAELSFDHGIRSGDRAYHLAAAAYAWEFMFPKDRNACPTCYDPRLRTAMDLYNRGITLGLAGDKRDVFDIQPRVLPLPYGSLEVASDPTAFTFGGYQLENYISLADFKVRGLRNRYHRRGLGAALGASVADAGQQSVDRRIPPRARVPVTAILRFEHPRREMADGVLHGRIELYDVGEQPDVDVDGTKIPLESDTTAALAYSLEGAPVWDFEIAGFRRGDFELGARDNLILVRPYHPGRIPVVFVHGTASSPARWSEMFNELMNDPVIDDDYQYWFFLYNTGNPIPYSAMRLREALERAVAELDPTGIDASLRRMVVVGHSQGGLLTKMTAVSSGTRFWDNIGTVPFERITMDKDLRELLHRALFVEPLPFVQRVIFIATPHHGSFLAANFLGNIARKLVSLPGNLTRMSLQIASLQARGALKTAFTLPTSIDNMRPKNTFLTTLLSLPLAPGVHAHSIIAVQGDEPVETGNDGVVEYSSAHIDGVDSELVVRSSHSTQGVPETIEEVRRILYLHRQPDKPSDFPLPQGEESGARPEQ